MTVEFPMFPSQEIEVCEPFAISEAFCNSLVRIERLGSCRRLVFAVSDRCGSERIRNVVAKLIIPAEIMAEIAQMIAADRPEPGTAFAQLPVDAVAHWECLTMTNGDHIETIQAYLDMLIIITASPDAEGAMPGINKVLFQIGDHVRAIEDNWKSPRLARA